MTHPTSIQHTDLVCEILHYMAAGVDRGLQGFERRSGKFLAPNGGWAVTHQDRIYALALLWATPGTVWHGDRYLFRILCHGGDALRSMQDSDGRWEFVKPDGSRWGKTYMPWSIYHWAETYALLRKRLTATRRDRWETGLRLAYEGLANEMQTPCAHNIPTWNGMSLVRGAQIFDESRWAIAGHHQIAFTTQQQDRAGFWPEGNGPTNGYNRVYVHALGLYYALTADPSVYEALRRACEFHATFTYPDGSAVETIDGRQGYAPDVSVMGWPGLVLFPKGRRLIRLGLDGLKRNRPHDGLAPHLASACRCVIEGDDAPIATDNDGRSVYHRRALVRRQRPWFISVNGFAPQPAERGGVARNRWIKTRANNLSVWHDRLGLLIGGGHSKNDPLIATFDVWDNGAQRLEPDAVTFRTLRGEERISMRFGNHRCRLRLQFPDRNSLAITFASDGRRDAVIRCGFTLRLRHGDPVIWQCGGRRPVRSETIADNRRAIAVAWTAGHGYVNPRLRGKGWTLDMPADSGFSYPVYPFNPYAIDNAAPPEQALGLVDVTLSKQTPSATFQLKVNTR